jgi:C4-dicarboxylate-specific signal transduction histidine kinase
LLRFACREEFQLEPCDVGELARTTLDAFRPQLRAAQVAVEAQTPSGIVARADREKLRQVLINLLQNALDVLAETPPQRRLSLAVSGHNGTAVVRLADNGPGVPPEVLPRLFEPFFSRKPNGTGLGLAIAKRTVEAHGGRIEVASTPGAGMTVTVFLPLSYARP